MGTQYLEANIENISAHLACCIYLQSCLGSSEYFRTKEICTRYPSQATNSERTSPHTRGKHSLHRPVIYW